MTQDDRINPAVNLMDESVIREMTRVSETSDIVNLAQGFPEYPVPQSVLEAAREALSEGRNRYTRTWGDPALRRDLAEHLERHWSLRYDPEEEIVITCGASEAIMASLLALLSPGDGIVIPEPIYENYLPGSRLSQARPAILPVDPFTGEWDADALDRALDSARVMILNTPANPIGKVWSAGELETVAELLEKHDVTLITDETYAWITSPGARHVPPATVRDLWRRTVTISSFSKTYAVTGWRVGFAAAPEPIMAGIRKVHDFLTVCAPAPFQHALRTALNLPIDYYRELAAAYRDRYERFSAGLREAGYRVNRPDGTYFLLVDIRHLEVPDDRRWAIDLAREKGVAGVPGSAFLYAGLPRSDGKPPDRRGIFLRLSFGKGPELLERAVERLRA